MPVFTSAPMPPAEAPATEIRKAGSEHAVLDKNGLRIHMLGPQVIDTALMQRTVSQAKDLSDAVRALAILHHDAGYPAARLRYGLDGAQLYVLVVLGAVTRVDVQPPLLQYFDDLRAGPLTDETFEPRRALASVHADRAGLNAEPIFVPQAGGGYALDMKPDSGGPRPFGGSVEFNNHGNRFVGRHFLETSLRGSLASGDEFTLGWRTSLTGLSDDARSKEYNEYGGGWSRVTPLGIFGVSGQYSEYDFAVNIGSDGLPVDAETTFVEASWLYPLAADFDRRWMVSALLDYSNKEIKAQNEDTRLQHQELGILELGTALTQTWRWTRSALEVGGGMQIRHGLGEDRESESEVLADLSYWLLRPDAHAEFVAGQHWNLRVEARGQIAGDTLPEEAQWVLGGVDTLHAWLPGVLVGDSGALARIQLDYSEFPSIYRRLDIKPGVFVETGYARFAEPDIGGNRAGTATLSDLGARIAFEFGPWLRATVSTATSIEESGISDEVLNATESDWFFSILAKF